MGKQHSCGTRTKLNNRKKKAPCQTNRKKKSVNILKRMKTANMKEPINQKTFITDLNDDCLLEIFPKLELSDQLALVQSHPRFESPFEIFAKTNFKSVNLNDFDENLNSLSIETFFSFAGNYIEKFTLLTGDADKDFCVELMKYCKSLKMLLIEELKPSSICKVLPTQCQLRSLFLTEIDINDDIWIAIANLPQLEQLVLTEVNFNVCQNSMMPNLRELHLIYCNDVNSTHFKNALLLMPSLNVLSIYDGKHLKLTDKNLSQFWQNLEVLNSDCATVDLELIPKLDNLKNLSIDGNNSEVFLAKLAHERSQQIESLGIDCDFIDNMEHLISKFQNLKNLRYCHATDDFLIPLHSLPNLVEIEFCDYANITNRGLLILLEYCCNLKRVTIEKTEIDNDFAKDLLPLLKQKKRPNGLLTLFAYESEIEKEELPKEYSTEEFQELARFVFEPVKAFLNPLYSCTLVWTNLPEYNYE